MNKPFLQIFDFKTLFFNYLYRIYRNSNTN